MKNLLLIAVLCGCTAHGQDLSAAYRKGNYRLVADTLSKKATLGPKDLYLLGQSSLELRRTNQAWEALSRIDYKKFLSDKDTSFLFPFYVDAYLKAGFAQNAIAQPLSKDDKVLAMASHVPISNAIKADIDDRLLAFLWKEKNYPAMMIANTNLSAQGKVWIELAKFAQGLPYNIATITSSWRTIPDADVYQSLLTSINPASITVAAQARMLAEVAVKIPVMHELAIDFALRYWQLSKDKELVATISNQVLLARSQPDAAAKLLHEHLKKEKKAGLSFYRIAQSQLIRRNMLKEALEISQYAYAQHGNLFSTEYAVVLETQQKPDVILAWYKKHYKTSAEELHNQVFRSLIRSGNLKLAESALDLGYEANSNFASYHLMRGLIKERLGKTEAAYTSYLEALMLEPFGYPGVRARPREAALRSKHRKIFEDRSAKEAALLNSNAVHRRLLTSKAFLMDTELAPLVDKDRLKKDQAEHDALVLKGLEIAPIPELEALDRRLTNFSLEMQAYLENTVQKAASQSSERSALTKYYFKYRSLFTDSEIVGYLTFRLFYYLRDLYGNATYMLIFSKDLLSLVYPRPEWEMILKESENSEDLAYWMLSSFHQESHFRKRVFSHVGAVGFAQVMGYTARDIKNWMRRSYLENTDFIDNLTMGIYYHKRMFDLHEDNYIFGMAAYNAGPGRVRTWRKRYAAYLDDMDLFSEAIDIRETRTYVRIVVNNRAMYDLVYKRPDLWL